MSTSTKNISPCYPDLERVDVTSGLFDDFLKKIRTVSAKDILKKFPNTIYFVSTVNESNTHSY